MELVGDYFEFDRDSSAQRLDLLANDHNNGAAATPRIVEISPLHFGGTIAIGDDGRSIVYQPPAGFIGSENLTYRVQYGPSAHDFVQSSVTLSVIDPLLPVDDSFHVTVGSSGAPLDVLANDLRLVGSRNVGGSMQSAVVTGVTTPSSAERPSFPSVS